MDPRLRGDDVLNIAGECAEEKYKLKEPITLGIGSFTGL